MSEMGLWKAGSPIPVLVIISNGMPLLFVVSRISAREIRRAQWPGVTLRRALWRTDRNVLMLSRG